MLGKMSILIKYGTKILKDWVKFIQQWNGEEMNFYVWGSPHKERFGFLGFWIWWKIQVIREPYAFTFFLWKKMSLWLWVWTRNHLPSRILNSSFNSKAYFHYIHDMTYPEGQGKEKKQRPEKNAWVLLVEIRQKVKTQGIYQTGLPHMPYMTEYWVFCYEKA